MALDTTKLDAAEQALKSAQAQIAVAREWIATATENSGFPRLGDYRERHLRLAETPLKRASQFAASAASLLEEVL